MFRTLHIKITLFITVFFGISILALPSPPLKPDGCNTAECIRIRSFVQEMVETNNQYVKTFDAENASSFLKKQTPVATVIMCSDSRVHNEAFNDTPVNELFIIRNIGNQFPTAAGSIEYGIRHLHTPVLLIIGHSGCGAIDGGMKDFSHESDSIQKELGSLKLNLKQSLEDNIIKNVHNQVRYTMMQFSDLIEAGKLVVIGAVYDVHNAFKLGNSRLILLNINNQTNPQMLKDDPHIKGLKNITFLGE